MTEVEQPSFTKGTIPSECEREMEGKYDYWRYEVGGAGNYRVFSLNLQVSGMEGEAKSTWARPKAQGSADVVDSPVNNEGMGIMVKERGNIGNTSVEEQM